MSSFKTYILYTSEDNLPYVHTDHNTALSKKHQCSKQSVKFLWAIVDSASFWGKPNSSWLLNGILESDISTAVAVRTWMVSAFHYCDVKMGTIASQITSLTIIYSIVYSGTDQRKHQSSASLAFVRRIHRWSVNSPRIWPVPRKILPFDDAIMYECHKRSPV